MSPKAKKNSHSTEVTLCGEAIGQQTVRPQTQGLLLIVSGKNHNLSGVRLLTESIRYISLHPAGSRIVDWICYV